VIIKKKNERKRRQSSFDQKKEVGVRCR